MCVCVSSFFGLLFDFCCIFADDNDGSVCGGGVRGVVLFVMVQKFD